MREKCFLEAARAVSLASDYPKAHLGCVITHKGKIIASGCNSTKTHTLQSRYNVYRFSPSVGAIHSLHAETAAIVSFLNISHRKEINPKECTLYIYREWKNGRVAMARPCPSCMQLIKNVGFRNIVYTTFDGVAHEKISYSKEKECIKYA